MTPRESREAQLLLLATAAILIFSWLALERLASVAGVAG